MKMPRKLAALAIAVTMAWLVSTAGAASAEWFADIYAGASFTESNDVTVHRPAGLTIFRDVEFDRSLTFGGRVGRYFDAVPFLGVGVDLSRFSPRIGPQSVHVDGCVPSGGCGGGQGGTGRVEVETYALSIDLMLRLPLRKTEDAPWGSIQPYLMGGLPLVRTTITPRTTAHFRNHDDETDYSLGYKFGGGLALHVARHLMVFAEYRFTHVQPTVELRDAATLDRTPLRMDLDTHSALVGLSVRW
jgi:opacity protein-like surface antigen